MQQLSITIKVLEKHANVVKTLLAQYGCDSVFTGASREECGTDTQNWFISKGIDDSYLSVEKSLEDLSIPYNRVCHGHSFKPYSHRHFRIDSSHKPQLHQWDHGDNTLALLDELETAIAGNDYAFARMFINTKRKEHLSHLNWRTQEMLTTDLEVA